MTKDGQALTAAGIRYLLAIRALDAERCGARSSDIARQLGVTRPSAFAMIRNLREIGLVEKEKYGTVFLTERGRQRAEQYADCYALVLRLMERFFGCSGADCRNAASALLADMPEGDLPLLQERLQRAE